METSNQHTRAEEVAQQWHIFSWLNFRCNAVSDGGIDDDHDQEYHRFSLRPEDVLFSENGEAIGVRYGAFTFYFNDPATHKHKVVEKQEYVGGWGNVTETRYYKLEKGDR